jgi:hypothetical protein
LLCLVQEMGEFAVVLFYKYVRILDPAGFVEEIKAVCTGLGLTGRVLVAEEVRCTARGFVAHGARDTCMECVAVGVARGGDWGLGLVWTGAGAGLECESGTAGGRVRGPLSPAFGSAGGPACPDIHHADSVFFAA